MVLGTKLLNLKTHTILPLARMVQKLGITVLSGHGTAKNVCHHKFSIWLIGLFNVNWVFFQIYFLFSFQQRCKTVKLDFKPLRSGQILTSTRKNWRIQVSTTQVLTVCFVWQGGIHKVLWPNSSHSWPPTYLPGWHLWKNLLTVIIRKNLYTADISRTTYLLKSFQNKKDIKILQVHRFQFIFSTSGSWEKDT